MAAALVVGASLGSSGPAQAAAQDGILESGEFGLYRHSFHTGGLFDSRVSRFSYSGYYYINTSVAVGDNASSSINRHNNSRVCAYEHRDFGGRSLLHLPYDQVNGDGTIRYSYTQLGWASDRLSSHRWVSSSC